MKEGEWTGNGSCGDSTAGTGAADRCTGSVGARTAAVAASLRSKTND